MARIRGDNHAFGWPGLEPRWTHGDKDGIGTAYSAASRIWFTVWNGIVTEVYYPTVDMPQMRDVQLLFTDGESFFHQSPEALAELRQRYAMLSKPSLQQLYADALERCKPDRSGKPLRAEQLQVVPDAGDRVEDAAKDLLIVFWANGIRHAQNRHPGPIHDALELHATTS
jgi:hypothetical protein